MNEIGHLSFRVPSDDICFIGSPKEFYSILLEKIRSCKRRILLSSLYLGTGPLEKELVSALDEKLTQSSNVEVQIFLDGLRGTRGTVSSCDLLLPLIEKHGNNRVSLHLYVTHYLGRFTRNLIPERFNETLSLSHLKVFLIDDDVILSGANLSESYFSNREDRYTLFKGSKELSDFYHDLFTTVISSIFHRIVPGSERANNLKRLSPLSASQAIQFKQRFNKFWMNASGGSFRPLLNPNGSVDLDKFALVYPTFQAGPFGIDIDEKIICEILRYHAEMEDNVQLNISVGYFNLPREYTDILLRGRGKVNILLAAPEANGFHGASGISRFIPLLYSHLEEVFFERISRDLEGNSKRISLHEWSRPGWSFHCKGIWLKELSSSSSSSSSPSTFSSSNLPFLTSIGSPNFGHRSLRRDLESQLIISSRNVKLQRAINEDYERIFKWVNPVTFDTFKKDQRRKVPLFIRGLAKTAIRTML